MPEQKFEFSFHLICVNLYDRHMKGNRSDFLKGPVSCWLAASIFTLASEQASWPLDCDTFPAPVVNSMNDRHAVELRSDYYCLMLLGCCRSWESLAQMIKNPTVLFCLAFVLKRGQLNSWAGRSSQLPEGLIIQLCKVKTNISSGLSWSHCLVCENSFTVKRCRLSPAAHCRGDLAFYPIPVLDTSIPHSFSAPSSPSLGRNIKKKRPTTSAKLSSLH